MTTLHRLIAATLAAAAGGIAAMPATGHADVRKTYSTTECVVHASGNDDFFARYHDGFFNISPYHMTAYCPVVAEEVKSAWSVTTVEVQAVDMHFTEDFECRLWAIHNGHTSFGAAQSTQGTSANAQSLYPKITGNAGGSLLLICTVPGKYLEFASSLRRYIVREQP
jgi:hypothetical protein